MLVTVVWSEMAWCQQVQLGIQEGGINMHEKRWQTLAFEPLISRESQIAKVTLGV